jgi:20S proteasome alpha/beta subunit
MARSSTQEAASALLRRLGTSPDGLSLAEVARRLRDQGTNEMSRVHVARKVLDILRSILNPLAVILLIAGVASAFSVSLCKPR